MKQLFGTDGIRGIAGEFPLDEKTVSVIGASLARQLREKLGREPRFISGRDTRESGGWIETAFHAGAAAEGAVCESAEVITTPGVAYLARAFDFDAGIVVSASHNPFQDNGLKIFSAGGKKIDDATEREIEADISRANPTDPVPGAGIKTPSTTADTELFRQTYLDHLKREANGFSLKGVKIVVDCANGASSHLAPALFSSMNANVVVINNRPDGRNINHDCGSLHLQHLQSRVLEEQAEFGVAFDGDADRALFVDENGKIVDGDATLWILSRYLQDHSKLANSMVVATVMSNIGLEIALKSMGIQLLRTDVGDKYVLEKLIETGSEIGGEQSGHIIFPAITLVGDGMMTALLLLRAICEKGVSLSAATVGFVAYPQILLNTKVRDKRPFSDVPEIAEAASKVETELNGVGRLLLRYSGTENLARVMIEGKEQSVIEAQARRLATVIERALG